MTLLSDLPTNAERWRPVVGFEGYYEVSDHGRVRSLTRWVARVSKRGSVSWRLCPGQILAPGRTPGGYLQAHLYKNGLHSSFTMHALVLMHFVSPRPLGQEGLHLDHDKENNRLENLAWGTKAENERQKLEAGRTLRGEKSAAAKLTAKDVAAIRSRAGEPQQDLADEFGCTFSNISAIQLRKSWKHV